MSFVNLEKLKCASIQVTLDTINLNIDSKIFFKNKDNFCSNKKSYHLWHAKWSVPYNKRYCCLTPNEQVFSYIMARTSYITNVLRVIQNKLDFYSVRSLKQQFAGKHVAPLEPIILIPRKPV